jgi:hypothetical protein
MKRRLDQALLKWVFWSISPIICKSDLAGRGSMFALEKPIERNL